jgi:hypothetical protein
VHAISRRKTTHARTFVVSIRTSSHRDGWTAHFYDTKTTPPARCEYSTRHLCADVLFCPCRTRLHGTRAGRGMMNKPARVDVVLQHDRLFLVMLSGNLHVNMLNIATAAARALLFINLNYEYICLCPTCSFSAPLSDRSYRCRFTLILTSPSKSLYFFWSSTRHTVAIQMNAVFSNMSVIRQVRCMNLLSILCVFHSPPSCFSDAWLIKHGSFLSRLQPPTPIALQFALATR